MQSLSMRQSAAPARAARVATAQGLPLLPRRLPSSSAPRAFVAGSGGAERAAEAAAVPSQQQQHEQQQLLAFKQLLLSASSSPARTGSSSSNISNASANAPLLAAAAALAAALACPESASAAAEAALGPSNPFEGAQASSLYVTLGLFLMSVPGIWSQVKRAPKSKIKRITFEVPGPKAAAPTQPVPLDDHARAVFRYFKRYNYDVVSTGEVITFAGVYAADRGQAAAVTLYTFFGLGSVALVLATLFPSVGGAFYGLTALSPLAAVYYFRNGERREEVRVKMVASDDEATADVVIEGDADEIERLSRELGYVEKGKVRVKGILEGSA